MRLNPARLNPDRFINTSVITCKKSDRYFLKLINAENFLDDNFWISNYIILYTFWHIFKNKKKLFLRGLGRYLFIIISPQHFVKMLLASFVQNSNRTSFSIHNSITFTYSKLSENHFTSTTLNLSTNLEFSKACPFFYFSAVHSTSGWSTWSTWQWPTWATWCGKQGRNGSVSRGSGTGRSGWSARRGRREKIWPVRKNSMRPYEIK